MKKLLTTREPKQEYKQDLVLKRKVHDVRMNKRDENEKQLTKEMFRKALENIRKKGGNKYEFFLKAGNSLTEALFKLYKVVWQEEKIPESWRETTVIQLNKGQNPKNDLEKIRNIHTKKDVAKLFSHIVVNKIKPVIEENISPFQIGAIPGHRPEEHLFVFKSVLALVEENDEAISSQLVDLAKFFDSEWLVDIMSEMYRGKIRGKPYRLIYELNKRTNITVRTSVGDSKSIETKENMAQGLI